MSRPPIWPVRLIECDYGGPQQSRPEGFEDGTDTVVLTSAGVNQFGHTLYDIVQVIPESMSWSHALRCIHIMRAKHRPKNLMVVVGTAHTSDEELFQECPSFCPTCSCNTVLEDELCACDDLDCRFLAVGASS